MKRRRVRSALRNFGYSFTSLTNYVDGGYICDLLPDVLQGLPVKTLTIHLPDGRIEPARAYPDALVKSVESYAAHFDEHVRSEGVDPGALRDCRLTLSWGPGLRCEAMAIDDLGKEHRVRVS